MTAIMLLATILVSTFAAVQGGHYTSFKIEPEYVWASSVYFDNSNGFAGPKRAVDRNSDPNFTHGSTFATSYHDLSPFMDIYMGAKYQIYSVQLKNRGDSDSDRLHDIDIWIYQDNPRTSTESPVLCGTIVTAPAAGAIAKRICNLHAGRMGKYIRIHKTVVNDPRDVLQIVEVKIRAARRCP